MGANTSRLVDVLDTTEALSNQDLFFLAVAGCNVTVATTLIGIDGIDINQTDSNGRTALMIACQKGHLEMVDFLVGNKQIDLDYQAGDGNTAFHYLFIDKQYSVIDHLCEQGHKFNLLLNNESKSILDYAIAQGRIDYVRYIRSLLSDDYIQSHIGYLTRSAMLSGEENIIRLCIESDLFDPYHEIYQSQNCLTYSLVNDLHAISEILLNLPGFDCNRKNSDGLSPFATAILKRKLAFLSSEFAKSCFDPNSTDNKARSILMLAIHRSNLDAVDFLVNNFDINYRQTDANGQELADYVLKCFNPELFLLLVNIPHMKFYMTSQNLYQNYFKKYTDRYMQHHFHWLIQASGDCFAAMVLDQRYSLMQKNLIKLDSAFQYSVELYKHLTSGVAYFSWIFKSDRVSDLFNKIKQHNAVYLEHLSTLLNHQDIVMLVKQNELNDFNRLYANIKSNKPLSSCGKYEWMTHQVLVLTMMLRGAYRSGSLLENFPVHIIRKIFEFSIQPLTSDEMKFVIDKPLNSLNQWRTHIMPLNKNIRIIGDAILHNPGKLFPEKYTNEELSELIKQISIAKRNLIETGGGGIAANQCAEISDPYQMTIVGVYHDSEEHVSHISKRYPGFVFPEASVMINPEIISVGTDMMTFKHGCLSVPGGLRGELLSRKEMQISYLTLDEGNKLIKIERKIEGMEAVAVTHEFNHILRGLTYVDCCFKELEIGDQTSMQHLIEDEIKQRLGGKVPPVSRIDSFYEFVSIGEDEKSKFIAPAFKRALDESLEDRVLDGISSRTNSKANLSSVQSVTWFKPNRQFDEREQSTAQRQNVNP